MAHSRQPLAGTGGREAPGLSSSAVEQRGATGVAQGIFHFTYLQPLPAAKHAEALTSNCTHVYGPTKPPAASPLPTSREEQSASWPSSSSVMNWGMGARENGGGFGLWDG